MIYYNINESTIKFKYNDFTFYFSSQFYLDKFKRLYAKYIKDETNKLNVKYGSNLIIDELLLISLYKRIEKRGFKIEYNNEPLKDYYIENKFVL